MVQVITICTLHERISLYIAITRFRETRIDNIATVKFGMYKILHGILYFDGHLSKFHLSNFYNVHNISKFTKVYEIWHSLRKHDSK